MRVVTFGEIMARLAAPGFLRLRQALPGSLDITFAGAEANVAVSLANFGAETDFVTVLPDNALADACVASLAGFGVGTRHVSRDSAGRLGLYFLETGANQRPSTIVYDRDGSSLSLAEPERFAWAEIFPGADWFHVTGITPAVSHNAAKSVLRAVAAAKELNVPVSCDLNFRKKLWRWEPGIAPRDLAERTMREILMYVDVVIANEEDCGDVLGITAENTNVAAGELNVDRYPDVARQLVKQFPNVSRVATTLRESISASHNNWGGMLYDAATDAAAFAPLVEDRYEPYRITNIVDRVGAGDAFAAALIFALNTPQLAQTSAAVSFAVAASCLAHSHVGDFNFSSRDEVEALMRGAASGRVQR